MRPRRSPPKRLLQRRAALGTVLLASLLSACASPLDIMTEPTPAMQIVRANRDAAEALARALSGRVHAGAPVLVSTVVNLDRLEESSSFGRMVAEQVSAGLVRHGVPVIELRMRNELFIRSGQGELMLSREVRDLTLSHSAQFVVVGTYTVAGATAYVTLRAVDPSTNIAHAAHSYTMPLGGFSYRSS
ncbi:MAG: FlgO family outer membrane protein [Burkholderiaceae bacterium]